MDAYTSHQVATSYDTFKIYIYIYQRNSFLVKYAYGFLIVVNKKFIIIIMIMMENNKILQYKKLES